MSETVAFSLHRFTRALQVAHHIPGRIRLKLAAEAGGELMAMAAEAKRFANALAGQSGIRSVSFNPLAKSCTVEYDPQVIPPTAWGGLLSGQPAAGSDILLQTLAEAANA